MRSWPAVDEGTQVHAERQAAGEEGAQALVEQVERGRFAAFQRRQQAARRQGGLADAGRADHQRVGAADQAAAEQLVEAFRAGRAHLRREVEHVLGRHQARIHRDAAGIERVVVVAATEADAAHLDDVDAAPLLAEFLGDLFEADDAVGDAVQVLVGLAGLVVQQQHGAVTRREELLQGQDLAPVAQRVLGQQAHLRQAVEDHAHRFHALDLGHDVAGGLAEFDFRRVEHRLLGIDVERQVAGQFEQRQASRSSSRGWWRPPSTRRWSRTA